MGGGQCGEKSSVRRGSISRFSGYPQLRESWYLLLCNFARFRVQGEMGQNEVYPRSLVPYWHQFRTYTRRSSQISYSQGRIVQTLCIENCVLVFSKCFVGWARLIEWYILREFRDTLGYLWATLFASLVSVLENEKGLEFFFIDGSSPYFGCVTTSNINARNVLVHANLIDRGSIRGKG